jgi:hypothetical protein
VRALRIVGVRVLGDGFFFLFNVAPPFSAPSFLDAGLNADRL